MVLHHPEHAGEIEEGLHVAFLVVILMRPIEVGSVLGFHTVHHHALLVGEFVMASAVPLVHCIVHHVLGLPVVLVGVGKAYLAHVGRAHSASVLATGTAQ